MINLYGVNVMKLVKIILVLILVNILLCTACSGVGSISAQDKQKIEEVVREEYRYLVNSRRIQVSTHEIDQLKILGKGSSSRDGVEIYCVVVLPMGSTRWRPIMAGKLGDYWEAMYPYETEWNWHGCGDYVDYDLDFY
jgi:hypothetical protein